MATRIPCGDFELQAAVSLEQGAAAAVVCHPHPAFGGRMDTPLVSALADSLGAAGLSTVRFNFRGLGESGGKPTGGLLEQDDVRAVLRWLRERGAERVALVGYSFGALMAMKAVAEGELASAFVAVGFPTSIIGDNADRLADVARAIASGTPWLFLQGDKDVLCHLERVEGWANAPHVEVQTLAGEGHFFAGPAQEVVVRRVTAFVTKALAVGDR